MSVPVKGTVHGLTVTLDALVPSLEGKRVLVLLESVEERSLPAADAAAAWSQWVKHGPQGPLEIATPEDFP